MLVHLLQRAALVAVLGAPAVAQTDLSFNINQPQSNFTWSGTSSFGAIVGNPSNAFQLAGTSGLRIYPLANDAIASADFPGTGDAAVVPNIRGKINNPIPFLPPLATLAIDNLHLKITAPQFAVAANGAFTATVTMTYLSGTMTTVAAGQTTVSDLTGQQSAPTPQNGTLTQVGSTLNLVMPVNTTFPFADPTSGVSGSITINGTVRGSWSVPTTSTYCTAKVNSLGCSPAIAGLGVPSTSAPSGFIVSCSQVLPNRSGQMFYGRGQNSAPFQGGFICVQSPLRRTPLQVASNGTGCGGTYAFDFNVWMASGVDPSLVAGSNVFACWWMRDPGASFNTGVSNAMTFTICP
jgi:hypothetical protein